MNDAPPTSPESSQAQSNPDSWQKIRQWAKTRAAGPASSVLSKVGLALSRLPRARAVLRRFGRILGQPLFAADDRAGKRAQQISVEVFRAAIEHSLQGRPASRDRDVYIETHFDRLLHTINVIAEMLPSGGRMIDFSAARFFADAVRKLQPGVEQTSVTGVNFERDDYVPKYGTGAYDMCLNTEVLEHLLFDPAHMICAINRMLKRGGLLFLSTPNALAMANALQLMQGLAPTLWNQVKPDEPYYERHNREWTPFEVVKILEEHGFEVLEVYTQDFYGSTRKLLQRQAQHIAYLQRHSSHQYFGDTMCILARKRAPANAPVRNPWLYAYHERHAPGGRVAAGKVMPGAQAKAAVAGAAPAAKRPAAKTPGIQPAAKTQHRQPPAKTAVAEPGPAMVPAAKPPVVKKAAMKRPAMKQAAVKQAAPARKVAGPKKPPR